MSHEEVEAVLSQAAVVAGSTIDLFLTYDDLAPYVEQHKRQHGHEDHDGYTLSVTGDAVVMCCGCAFMLGFYERPVPETV